MIHRIATALALVSVLAYACSEATDGLVPPDDSVDGTSDGDSGAAAAPGSATSSKKPSVKSEAGTVSASVVLFNEISAESDWVELVNSGNADVDLGGWQVADLDKATGGPKLTEAASFTTGTTLPAGGYGLVQAGGVDGGKACPSGGAAVFCVHAAFGIGKSGETVFLIASDGGVVGSLDYPPNAASGSDTWGRIPSGDPNGAFEVTAGTPGAANTSK